MGDNYSRRPTSASVCLRCIHQKLEDYEVMDNNFFNLVVE